MLIIMYITYENIWGGAKIAAGTNADASLMPRNSKGRLHSLLHATLDAAHGEV